MSGENPWNQNHVPHSTPFHLPPAEFNRNDGSVSFQQFPQPRKELNMIQDLYPQNNQMIQNECSMMQRSISVIRQFPGKESGMIQGQYPFVNQPSGNGLNMNQDSNLLYHKLSSNASSVFKASYPPTDQMLVNKSNGNTYLQRQLSSERAQPPTDRVFANTSYGSTNLQRKLSSEGAHPPTDQMFINKLNGSTYLQRQQSSEGTHLPTDRMFANTSNGTRYLQRQLSSEGTHQQTDQMFSNASNGTIYLQRQLSSEGAQPPTNRMFANTSNGTRYLQRQQSSEGAHLPTDRMFANTSNGTRYLQRQQSSEGAHLPTDQMLANASNGTTYLQRQLSSEGTQPPTDRMFANTSNGTTYLQQHQLSSEGASGIRDFHPLTYQLPANGSNFSQQFCSLNPQLPSIEMNINQNSKMFNQQLFKSASEAKNIPNHMLSQNEFNGNPVKYAPNDWQSVRKSKNQDIKDELGSIQNQNIPLQQNVGNQLSTHQLKMALNGYHELQISGRNSYQYLLRQYSEKVSIYVIGPPHCGKADLIRIFIGDDKIRISTDKPLSRVIEHALVGFDTTLKIEICHGENLPSTVNDIKSLCQSSKSAIVLVYSLTQEATFSDAEEWIKALKRDIDFNVPIILVGNNTGADFSRTSSEFPEAKPNIVQFEEGVKVKNSYNLAAFYECSKYGVKNIVEIFIVATFLAFNRTI